LEVRPRLIFLRFQPVDREGFLGHEKAMMPLDELLFHFVQLFHGSSPPLHNDTSGDELGWYG
jgi:hypothetical protein